MPRATARLDIERATARARKLVAPHRPRPETLRLDEEILEDVLDQLDSKASCRRTRARPTTAARILEELRSRAQGGWPSCRARSGRERKRVAYPRARRAPDAALAGKDPRWRDGRRGDRPCREATDLPDDVYDIFVVDSVGRLRGSVPLGRMLRTKRPVPIADIVDPDIPSVPASADQVEVAHLFRDKNLVSCPVVDERGRLEGVIMVDDVVDVIERRPKSTCLDGRRWHRRMHSPPVRTARLRRLGR